MSFTQDSQVMGTANMVSNAGTVILNVVQRKFPPGILGGVTCVLSEASHLLVALKSIGFAPEPMPTIEHVITISVRKLFNLAWHQLHASFPGAIPPAVAHFTAIYRF